MTAGGDPETFTITVDNGGASDADGVNVTDSVDGRLLLDSTSGDFDCAASSGQSLDCTLAHLAAGEDATITVTYHVDADEEADASVSNSATVTSDEPGTDTDSDTVAIVEDVVLDVTKTFADASVEAGTSGHTFTVEVTNNGASEADDVILTDDVDNRLIVTDVNGFDCSAWSVSTPSAPCPELAAGDTATMTVTYTVAASTAAATVSNTGSATSDDGGTGSDSDSVDIATKANIADLKVVTRIPCSPGISSSTRSPSRTTARRTRRRSR